MSFDQIAPYLENPLVLLGFVIFVLTSLFAGLVKAKIIPALSKKSAEKVVHRMLNYSFVLAVLIVLGGFLSHAPTDAVKEHPLHPLHTVWLFAGYYNLDEGYYAEGPYVDIAYEVVPLEEKVIPQIGDIVVVTKDRNSVIMDFKKLGIQNQYDAPNDRIWEDERENMALIDNDYTEILVEKDTQLITRDVSIGETLNEETGELEPLQSVWLRVAECHTDVAACEAAN